MSCNDNSVNVGQLVPGNPKGPASSYMPGFQIILNFDGGAALNNLMLPNHGNILTIKILILLPGETSHIPYMGGQVGHMVFCTVSFSLPEVYIFTIIITGMFLSYVCICKSIRCT